MLRSLSFPSLTLAAITHPVSCVVLIKVRVSPGSHSIFPCSAYDLENKVIGTVGAGRIGQRVLTRLQASLGAGLRIAILATNPDLIK